LAALKKHPPRPPPQPPFIFLPNRCASPNWPPPFFLFSPMRCLCKNFSQSFPFLACCRTYRRSYGPPGGFPFVEVLYLFPAPSAHLLFSRAHPPTGYVGGFPSVLFGAFATISGCLVGIYQGIPPPLSLRLSPLAP